MRRIFHMYFKNAYVSDKRCLFVFKARTCTIFLSALEIQGLKTSVVFLKGRSRRWWNSNLLYLQHNRKICNGDDYFKTRRNWFNASVRSTSVRAIMNILIYFLTNLKMMVQLYFFSAKRFTLSYMALMFKKV